MSTPLTSQLFADAESAGDLSPDSTSLLNPLGKQIGRALSTVDPIRADRITLVTLLIDNTGSLEYVNPDPSKNPQGLSNADVVREGHDNVWQSLAGAKTADSIQALSAFIVPSKTNDGIHFNFRPLSGWEKMTKKDHYLHGHTPLFDATIRTLGAVAAETQKYLSQGIEVFSVTLILTDGDDNNSQHSAADVATVVKDLLRQERHKIFLGGVALDGVDFTSVGKAMGLPKDAVRNIPADPKEIRAFLQLFSQSAIAMSQAANPNAVTL